MKTLYESIMQSRFGDHKIEESILDSDKEIEKKAKIAIIRNNLKQCNNIKEFSKLWSSLGLNINDSYWSELGGDKSYVCVRGKSRPSYLVYCKNGMIVIYNDEPELWKSDKEFTDYCNKVADILEMKKHTSRTQRGDECILQF